MRLKLLFGARCRVYAVAPLNAAPTEFEVQLQAMARQADAEGMFGRLRRFAELGRQGLTTAMFHSVDPAKEVWEFVKGDLRAFCFFDGNELIVMSSAIVKKSQKVDPAEVATAQRLRRQYFEAKAAGALKLGGENE